MQEAGGQNQPVREYLKVYILEVGSRTSQFQNMEMFLGVQGLFISPAILEYGKVNSRLVSFTSNSREWKG
jgi:hypothetical protein